MELPLKSSQFCKAGQDAVSEKTENPFRIWPLSGRSSDTVTDAGSSDNSGKNDGTGSEDANVPADVNKDMADRSRMPDEAKEAAGTGGTTPSASGALPKKEDSWVSKYLPYIFNGIGILFAY